MSVYEIRDLCIKILFFCNFFVNYLNSFSCQIFLNRVTIHFGLAQTRINHGTEGHGCKFRMKMSMHLHIGYCIVKHVVIFGFSICCSFHSYYWRKLLVPSLRNVINCYFVLMPELSMLIILESIFDNVAASSCWPTGVLL